jgi:hypothetical protein
MKLKNAWMPIWHALACAQCFLTATRHAFRLLVMTQTVSATTALSAGRKPGKLDWVIALGATTVLVVSALFTPEDPPAVSVCAFYSITGLPCPGCGLTRAFCCISHLRWGDAWGFNPFGFIWYALTIFLVVRPMLIRRTSYAERENKWMASRWSYIMPIVLVAGMWAFGLYRMWNAAKQRPAPTAVNSRAAEPASPSDPPALPAPARGEEADPSTDSRV